MNGNIKDNKAITLVALVVTIIVLIILAGISINLVIGEDGILKKTREGRNNYQVAANEEMVALADLENEIDNQKYIFDENIFKIEKAINANKYGYQVNTYTSPAASGYNGIWRLFYQDENLTYIISDEQVGNYNLNNLHSNYSNGESVSPIGINLNYKIKNLFNVDNNSPNIKGIAFFTDHELWDKYKDGSDAIFAIGSPTIELYIASYNAAASEAINPDREKLQEVENDEYGYTSQYSDLDIETYNHGIYSKACWIASPYSIGNSRDNYYFCSIGGGISINGSYNPSWTSNSVRPIVCIKTEDFQKNYTLTDE